MHLIKPVAFYTWHMEAAGRLSESCFQIGVVGHTSFNAKMQDGLAKFGVIFRGQDSLDKPWIWPTKCGLTKWPGLAGPLLRFVSICFSKNSQKRVPFCRVRLRSEQIRGKGILFVKYGQQGYLLMTIFKVWSHFGIFLKKYSPCNGHSKLFMLPFRDKGIILMLILVTHHAQILDLWFTSGLRPSFLGKGSEKDAIFQSWTSEIWVYFKTFWTCLLT